MPVPARRSFAHGVYAVYIYENPRGASATEVLADTRDGTRAEDTEIAAVFPQAGLLSSSEEILEVSVVGQVEVEIMVRVEAVQAFLCH